MPRRSRREDRAKACQCSWYSFLKRKGKKPSDTIEIPKGDQASHSFKRSVVNEMLKSGMVKRKVSKK